jgi:hypothetical protein
MTDIVPLVTHGAWGKSCENVDNSKKSIAIRGWGPLNYVFLDHPKIRKTILSDSGATTGNSNFDVHAVNTSRGFAGDIMGKIMYAHLKDKSRVETINKEKRKMSEAVRNIYQLK